MQVSHKIQHSFQVPALQNFFLVCSFPKKPLLSKSSFDNSNQLHANIIFTPSTTEIEIFLEGVGKIIPKAGNTAIHYTGVIINSNKLDSSRGKVSLFKCQIGVDRVIKGRELAIPQLSFGSRDIATIPQNKVVPSLLV